jgi:hypothetical protein
MNVQNVDPRKARIHVEGWGEAEVLDAFIDPRNGRWAYRLRPVGGGDTRIIYPDQIETLHWTVRGEMELGDKDAKADPGISVLLDG